MTIFEDCNFATSVKIAPVLGFHFNNLQQMQDDDSDTKILQFHFNYVTVCIINIVH